MILLLDQIGEAGLDLEGVLPVEALECQAEDPVRGVGPVQAALHCQIAGDELLVDGTLSVSTIMRCRRCNCEWAQRLEQVPYHYDEALDPMPESVDLTESVREAILLVFPSYPVCREDCKGLCAQCGVNLNETQCECKPPQDDRWGALEGLGKE